MIEKMKKREKKAKSQSPGLSLQFDYTLNVAEYQDEILRLDEQKKQLFEKLKEDESNNVYQLQFKKVNQSILNLQKLINLYKNEAMREMLAEGLKSIPEAQKAILATNPMSDEALQVLAANAARVEQEAAERAEITNRIEKQVYGVTVETISGVEFTDSEFLKMLKEEQEQLRQTVDEPVGVAVAIDGEVLSIKNNINEIITRLRMRSQSYEEKISVMRERYDGIKRELREKLTIRETAPASDCVFLDSDIDTLASNMTACENATSALIQAKAVCDSQLQVADAVAHQAYIDAADQFMVNGEVTSFKNAISELTMYLKNCREKGNEDMAEMRMAVDVLESVEIDKSRNLSEGLGSDLEQRFEKKDENKYGNLKTKLGI